MVAASNRKLTQLSVSMPTINEFAVVSENKELHFCDFIAYRRNAM
jgi:hypothetical protein